MCILNRENFVHFETRSIIATNSSTRTALWIHTNPLKNIITYLVTGTIGNKPEELYFTGPNSFQEAIDAFNAVHQKAMDQKN